MVPVAFSDPLQKDSAPFNDPLQTNLASFGDPLEPNLLRGAAACAPSAACGRGLGEGKRRWASRYFLAKSPA